MAGATPELTSVIGPMATAFPLNNEGWYMEGQKVTQGPEHPMRLSDLTIHEKDEITVNLTGRDTKDVSPNCEANWVRDAKTGRPRWPRPLFFDWSSVWGSLRTQLSDPTEGQSRRQGTGAQTPPIQDGSGSEESDTSGTTGTWPSMRASKTG